MVGRFRLEPSSVDLICFGQSLSTDADVDVAAAKRAICKEMPNVLPALKSISEGGLSYTIDTDNLLLWYSALCAETGEPNLLQTKSRISDASSRW